ncbi:hypothetical protein [Mycobacterium sp. SMC-4]|uniref:hypothetical protein n=1 Tax=Mycobacterium sp. SMC-4 TaxID=2857059 RepID=UPI0021B292A4|nr:hypothetical protein [Mycobacterium sp. SMC-4]UXA17894.1 hypothetical protein KXD98_24965 [Mycobacterium sp. SMC-4]
MAFRARIAAVALLAVCTLGGLACGTAGADPGAVSDRGSTRDTGDIRDTRDGRDATADRRTAARAADAKPEEPRRPRCKRRDQECGLGIPPDDADVPEAPSGSSDGIGLPGGLPRLPFPGAPQFPPPLAEPVSPEIIDTVPGISLPMNSHVSAPVNVPVLPVVPGVAAPRPAGTAGGAARPQTPPARPATREPARAPEPVTALGSSPVSPPPTYRVGYPEYLRGAGLPQIAAVALPGVAGILVLTGAGGLVGYRQAKAGRTIAVRSVTRFMN